jgi:hypothetical protein
MSSDGYGWLWLLVDVVGVIVLGALIAYGTMTYRRYRNRVSERERDEATRRVYESADK